MGFLTFSKNTTNNNDASSYTAKRISKLYKKDEKIMWKLKNCEDCNEETTKLWNKKIPDEDRISILECDNLVSCGKHRKLHLKHIMIIKEIEDLKSISKSNKN